MRIVATLTTLLLSFVIALGGTGPGLGRPSAFKGGGGGVSPDPPIGKVAPLARASVTVNSVSSPGPWIVYVTNAQGGIVQTCVVSAGTPEALTLPMVTGLQLDVVGTDAIGGPVAPGQSLEIWLP
jgi:hypothetical protein